MLLSCNLWHFWRKGRRIELMHHGLKTTILSILILLLLTSPAFANKIEATIWLFNEAWRLGVFAVLEFWGFLGFVVFVPLKKLMLGVVLTLGGAFLPDIPTMGKKKVNTGSANIDFTGVAKLNFRGAPRYAVLIVGILIVAASLWQGISDFSQGH